MSNIVLSLYIQLHARNKAKWYHPKLEQTKIEYSIELRSSVYCDNVSIEVCRSLMKQKMNSSFFVIIFVALTFANVSFRSFWSYFCSNKVNPISKRFNRSHRAQVNLLMITMKSTLITPQCSWVKQCRAKVMEIYLKIWLFWSAKSWPSSGAIRYFHCVLCRAQRMWTETSPSLRIKQTNFKQKFTA